MSVRKSGTAATIMTSVLSLGCLSLSVLGLASCTHTHENTAAPAMPARLVALPGSPVKEVVLTDSAVSQIGIEMTIVRAVPRNGASRITEVVPVAAVIYDPTGASWTYTNPNQDPDVFLRVPIVIERVDAQNAYLISGPPAGTPVVSQGADELLGVEYGVGEE